MSFFISDALAVPAAIAGQPGPGMEGMLFPLGILICFYLLFLRPQNKRAKEKKLMLASMTKGTEVVTTGGILGKVADLDENFVKLEVADNLFIQIQRHHVETMMPKGTYKAVTKRASVDTTKR